MKEKRERERERRMANLVVPQGQAIALEEYGVPNPLESQACIVKLTIETNNFKIKPAFIQMVSQYKFTRLPIKDLKLI